MWKKDDTTTPEPRAPETPTRQEATRASSPSPSTSRASTGEVATIGRSITIKGEVTGDEDLLIQGTVDGSVDLEEHSVTVGREGRVKANITGRVVMVEGEVEGDLVAQEQIILRSSASVQGDITAPRVVLEDGASFRGLVDMGEGGGAKGSKSTSARSATSPSSGSSPSSSSGGSSSGSSSSDPSSSSGSSSGSSSSSSSPGKGATASSGSAS